MGQIKQRQTFRIPGISGGNDDIRFEIYVYGNDHGRSQESKNRQKGRVSMKGLEEYPCIGERRICPQTQSRRESHVFPVRGLTPDSANI